MEFRVLGPLVCEVDGTAVDLGSPKQRALFALLLINANKVVSTDRVLDQLWGEAAEGKENAMWVYVSRLRSALEPARSDRGESKVLLTRDHGYMLSVDPDSIDAVRFEAAAAAGRELISDDPDGASALLEEALGLWRGNAYEDFSYEEFAQIEISRLEALRLNAVHDRIEADLRRGLAGELIGELEGLQRRHPLQERPVMQLMLALYRAGRQADALRAYQRFSRLLGEELGIEPSPELRRIEEQVLLHDTRLQSRRRSTAGAADAVGVGAVNPFKGLRAFREDDGGEFFGRERLVAGIIRRLEEGDRMVALVGPSGSGKSSLVKAGLIGAIRKGALPRSDAWTIAQMVPGSHPFVELEAALLRSSLDSPDSLHDQLQDTDNGLLRAALRVLPAEDSRLLLVIDQFEELFTLVEDENERARFLSALLPALDDPHGRVIVVLTLRADFYERPLAYPDFAARLGDGVVNVVPLTATELEEAAQKPAQKAGVSLEPALLAALLTDVVGRLGALPAFQYTLTELFDRRTGQVLTLEAFREMDGVWGALTRRAEDLFSELDEQQQAAARQLFLRLVTIADGDEWGRRRVPASEIVSLDVDVVALQRVIDLYTRHRLLTLDRDVVTGSPTIEVAHEALLTQWERLRGWIEESRDDVRRHAALTAAMNEWIEADRHPDYLLAGSRLEAYEDWADSTAMSLTTAEHRYLDAGTEARESVEREVSERSAHAERTARLARRRLWGLAAAVAVLVAIGIAAVIVALAPGPPVVAVIGIERDGLGGIADQTINGLEAAARSSDIDVDLINPLSNPRTEVEEYLTETQPDLVLTDQFALAGLGFDGAELPSDFPDVHFVYMEAPLGFVDLPNVTHILFISEEAAFLGGAAAAMTTKTGVVGFVGGSAAAVEEFRAGFEAGARYVDPDIEVLSRYLVGRLFEVFGDPSLGEDAAEALYERGADVVYHAAGLAGRGIFAAADRLSTEEIHRWGIGVDVDEYVAVEDTVRDHVLTSTLKLHDVAIQTAVELWLEGVLEPVVKMDLESGGFDYSRSGAFLDAATVTELERIRADIISGVIEAPPLSAGSETDPVPADGVTTVTFDGTTCSRQGTTAGVVGELLRIDFRNDSIDEEAVMVWDFPPGTTQAMLDGAQPWEISTTGLHSGVRAAPDTTHGLTIRLDAPGVWAITCVLDIDHTLYTDLITVEGG